MQMERGGFSSRRASARWASLESAMGQRIAGRQAAAVVEAEWERELSLRAEARKELAATERRLRDPALGPEEAADAAAQAEAQAERLRYIEGRIGDLQAEILSLEDPQVSLGSCCSCSCLLLFWGERKLESRKRVWSRFWVH